MSKVRLEFYIKGVTRIFQILEMNSLKCHDPLKGNTFFNRRRRTTIYVTVRLRLAAVGHCFIFSFFGFFDFQILLFLVLIVRAF